MREQLEFGVPCWMYYGRTIEAIKIWEGLVDAIYMDAWLESLGQ